MAEVEDPRQSDAVAKVAELIKDIRFAMLTTVSEGGELHSRPMATQDEEFDGNLWFLTKQDSGKVGEIRNDSHVNLAYSDAKNHSFVSVAGIATVSKDKAKIEQLWKPWHAAWFPGGKDDPEVTVLQVRAHHAEYWTEKGNFLSRSYEMVKAAATKTQADVGENKKVSLS